MKERVKKIVTGIAHSVKISIRASKLLFFLRVTLEGITVLLPVIAAYILRLAVDAMTEGAGSQSRNAIVTVAGLFGMYFLFQILSVVISRGKEIVNRCHQDLIGNTIEMDIVKQINSLDISYFDNVKFYDEITNSSRDSQALQRLAWIGIGFLRSCVQLVLCYVILGQVVFWVPALIFLLNIPSALIENRFVRKEYQWQRGRATHERKMNYLRYVLKNKQAAKDIRLYCLKDYFTGQYMRLWNAWFAEKRKLIVARGIWASIAVSLPHFCIIGMYLMIGVNIVKGKSTIGDFTYYSSIVGQFVGACGAVLSSFTQIYENEMRLENYRKFMQWKPIRKDDGTRKLDKVDEIEFCNVSFCYPQTERMVLQNLSFRIRPKERVAMVGVNGAGKTTMVKLLLRFYDATDGEIKINGHNIQEYDVTSLRHAFGVLLQDFCNYALTLKENIVLSDLERAKDITDDEIKKCCELAGFVVSENRFQNGVNTYLTREFDASGQELSGGEWQKLAVARAYFQDSSFLVLDEPSAALDAKAEEEVFRNMMTLCEEKGSLFITHRLSNVVYADRILVLENGQIIEEGKHEELLEKKAEYYNMFMLQAERYKMAEQGK